jgi:hypothetical protein
VTNKAWPKRILTAWAPDSMYFESFPSLEKVVAGWRVLVQMNG